MNAEIDAVRVAMTDDGPVPVVVLAPDDADEEVLPIFIGFEEAVSIARGMEAEDIGRPLTHDLTLDLVEELGGRVTRVVVSSLEDNTYIADLHIDTPRGDTVVDARPSDSLALAARTNAPIEIETDVFESGRRDREEFDQLQDIREVAELGP
ncbi:bifunctional nuclease family protein [Halorussus ruber]|uniref:bifunctional nuclease family protein n=1 Tax=Halorussus ruber TaxID=1126238 RepID=UPI0010931214|nr:bifunctional nuclease family protein [Halorussus ruber]